MSTKQIVPFRRWHLVWLMQDGAVGGRMPVDTELLMALEKQNSWTVVLDGNPLACGGTIQHWNGRHMAWVCLTVKTGPHMGFITRAVRKALSRVQGRIEMSVRKDFEAGHRWARMLGFRVETPLMEAYGPEGEDHVGYVRIER